jgi:hypothetical protein
MGLERLPLVNLGLLPALVYPHRRYLVLVRPDPLVVVGEANFELNRISKFDKYQPLKTYL